MAFARFMATLTGRLIRAALGLALFAIGYWVIGGGIGTAVAMVGVIPMLAALFNVCLIAPMIGAPFYGKDALKAPPAKLEPPKTLAGSH